MNFGIIGGGFGIYGWLSAISSFKEIQISTLSKYKNNIANRKDINNVSSLVKSITWIDNEELLIKNIDTLVIARRPIDQIKIIDLLIKNSWEGNLIIEKPIAPNPDLAIEVLNKLSNYNINLQVGFSINETKWSKKVSEFILTSRPSEILIDWNFYAHHYKFQNITWKSNPANGGGALNFYSIHLIAWLSSFSEWNVNYCSRNLSTTADPNVQIELENKSTKVRINCNSINKSKNLFSIQEVNNQNKLILKLDNPFAEESLKKGLFKTDYRVPYLIKIIEKALKNQWMEHSCLKKQTKLWRDIVKMRTII